MDPSLTRLRSRWKCQSGVYPRYTTCAPLLYDSSSLDPKAKGSIVKIPNVD